MEFKNRSKKLSLIKKSFHNNLTKVFTHHSSQLILKWSIKIYLYSRNFTAENDQLLLVGLGHFWVKSLLVH